MRIINPNHDLKPKTFKFPNVQKYSGCLYLISGGLKPFEIPSYQRFWAVLPVKRKGQISCMVETPVWHQHQQKTLHKTINIEKRDFPVFVYFLCPMCNFSQSGSATSITNLPQCDLLLTSAYCYTHAGEHIVTVTHMLVANIFGTLKSLYPGQIRLAVGLIFHFGTEKFKTVHRRIG